MCHHDGHTRRIRRQGRLDGGVIVVQSKGPRNMGGLAQTLTLPALAGITIHTLCKLCIQQFLQPVYSSQNSSFHSTRTREIMHTTTDNVAETTTASDVDGAY